MLDVVGLTPTDTRVRYIKLGEGGKWSADCFSNGIIRIGFGLGLHFDVCQAGRWEELAKLYQLEGSSKGKATEFANQARQFFEDDGILWITFSRRRLWWTFADLSKPIRPDPHDAAVCIRPVLRPWSDQDMLGNVLHMDGLSGQITQLASYRGTSCNVKIPDYVLRRIKGQRLDVTQEAEDLSRQLQSKIVEMMRLLTPQDFELLVDLIFSSSGWRRLSIVGGTEQIIDVELELPTTGERAFVQTKSRTTQKEFELYLAELTEMPQVRRMFYVFHTGKVVNSSVDVTLIGPERCAEMVMDAGLTSWLIRRVS